MPMEEHACNLFIQQNKSQFCTVISTETAANFNSLLHSSNAVYVGHISAKTRDIETQKFGYSW